MSREPANRRSRTHSVSPCRTTKSRSLPTTSPFYPDSWAMRSRRGLPDVPGDVEDVTIARRARAIERNLSLRAVQERHRLAVVPVSAPQRVDSLLEGRIVLVPPGGLWQDEVLDRGKPGRFNGREIGVHVAHGRMVLAPEARRLLGNAPVEPRQLGD